MKIKIIILMVFIILFTIFVSQNTKVIPVDIYFWQFQMSTIVLICLVFLLGLMAGFIISRIFDASSKKKRKEENNSRKLTE